MKFSLSEAVTPMMTIINNFTNQLTQPAKITIRHYAEQFFAEKFEQFWRDKMNSDDYWYAESLSPELGNYIRAVKTAFLREVRQHQDSLAKIVADKQQQPFYQDGPEEAITQNNSLDEVLAKLLAKEALRCIDGSTNVADEIKYTIAHRVCEEYASLFKNDKFYRKIQKLLPPVIRDQSEKVQQFHLNIQQLFHQKTNTGITASLLLLFPDEMLQFLFASTYYTEWDLSSQQIACDALFAIGQKHPDMFAEHKQTVLETLSSTKKAESLTAKQRVALGMFSKKFIGTLKQESEVAIAEQLKAGPR